MIAPATYTNCDHARDGGALYDCPRCGIKWHANRLARAQELANHHTRMIAKLRGHLAETERRRAAVADIARHERRMLK